MIFGRFLSQIGPKLVMTWNITLIVYLEGTNMTWNITLIVYLESTNKYR